MSQLNYSHTTALAYDWLYDSKVYKCQTIKQVAAKLPLSASSAFELARGIYPQSNGVRCISKGRKVITDFVKWISKKRLKGFDVQLEREPHPVIASNGLMILWHYRNTKGRYGCGVGVKWLAKKYGISQIVIMDFLRSSGINSSAKSNHKRPEGLLGRDRARRIYMATRFDIPTILRRRIMVRAQAAARGATVNGSGWFSHLGCTVEDFRLHLESLFTDGMTWKNYGTFWEIDHIKPCAVFDLTKGDQVAECFNYKNMQPLQQFQNRSKGMKYAVA
jgi:hypothetical protein